MDKHAIEVERQIVYVDDQDIPEQRRRRKIVRNTDAERRSAVTKVARFVWLFFGLLDTLLMFRFFLKLIGANPNNAFADFVYDLSGVFLTPFEGLLNPWVNGNMILEFSTLVAVVVYSIVAWVLVKLVWLVLYHPGKRIVRTFEEYD